MAGAPAGPAPPLPAWAKFTEAVRVSAGVQGGGTAVSGGPDSRREGVEGDTWV